MNNNLFWCRLLFCLSCVALFLFCCTEHLVDGGSGSTVTNGYVTGLLVDSNGNPSSGTVVRLLSNNYDPVKDAPVPDSMVDTTTKSGRYHFAASKNSVYNIQALNITEGRSALITGISVSNNDTFKVPEVTLTQPGAISITLPDSMKKPGAYVYIPGTTYFVRLGTNNDHIPDVPAGAIPSICYKRPSDSGYVVVTKNFTVSSGDTTSIFNNDIWTSSKRLILNTSVTGANVWGNVINFPVLIRLNSANFDFSRAQSNGADIRFTKSDNKFLPYQIERWDEAGKLAEIWVKVDTVWGNDSTQSIKMYWGNHNLSDASNSAVVFDTASGFAGVWHLDPSAGARVPDATVNGNNGAATSTTTVEGIIGTAQMFNGTSSKIQVTGSSMDKLNFSDTGSYSVSAWVKTNVLDSVYHSVVSKSTFQYGLQMRPKNEWEFFTYIDKSRWELSRFPALDNLWHSLVGVRNGKNQYFYFDGVCVDSSIVSVTLNNARAYDQPLEIGHCTDGGNDPDRYFNGAIDEVRISKIAYNADWIKLCYMNQNKNDVLVKW